MRAERRTLLVLLGLIALAGAALALLTAANRRAEEAEREAEEGSIPLTAFAEAELEAIEYTWQGQTVRLAYDGENWTLADDPDYHLDQTPCDTMAAALVGLRAKRRLEAQPGEDYGFAAPLVTVAVTAAGRTETFVFGDANPVTGDIYLQKAGEDAVYTADAARAGCFEVSREELFEPFNPAGITASRLETIRYTLADGEEVCLQAVSVPDESGADSAYTTVWRLADQPDAPLDEEKVESILSALGGYVSGQITPAAGADPAACGFDAPLAAVTAWDGAGEYVLTYAEGTDGYYLMVEGDGSVYRVDGAAANAFLPAEELKL